jgi:general secretion pathway protein C
MLARFSALVVWALVAATAALWTLRLVGRPAPTPVHSVAGGVQVGNTDLSRLFGSPPVVAMPPQVAAPESSRFRLVGVMAPRGSRSSTSGRYGLALISVDGKPARAFRVGSVIDSGLVLQSVGWRSASIGAGSGQQPTLLELPLPTPPNTATSLPSPGLNLPPVSPPPVPGAGRFQGMPPPSAQPPMPPVTRPPVQPFAQPFVPPAAPAYTPPPAMAVPPAPVTLNQPEQPADSGDSPESSNTN